MDQDDRERSDDYGYDLVHEIEVGVQLPADRPRREQHDAQRRASGGTDSDGDYGYDEAHDL